VLNFLADIAVSIGTKCADRATRYSKLRDRWVRYGWFWNDVSKWCRRRFSKPFAEIRAERESERP
jgi:hypothetical protein